VTWVKLDDAMPRHPKVVRLSVQAKWALIEIWCYAAAYKTDGYVEEPVAKTLARPKVIAELVAADLLHRNGKGWVIHDWLDHNISKEAAKKKRDDDAKRLQDWREEQARKKRESEDGNGDET
jgi:hypothetical protein